MSLVNQVRTPPSPARTAAPLAPSGVAALLPGVGLAVAMVAGAYVLRLLPGVGILSPMILAILLGIVWGNVVGVPAVARPGIAFAMRRLLRLAIILLGLQITMQDIAAVGAVGVALIAAALVSTFVFTVWMGRVLGVDAGLARLIAAGTSICGASAVIATNSVTSAPDEDVAYAVACVTIFGSIAMFAYPALGTLMALSPHQYGLWAGASIHEIAQVVAAAFQHGSEAGEFGTIAKLTRVAMLAPVVMTLGAMATMRRGGRNGATGGRIQLPWFVLGFVALAVFNSLVTLPEAVLGAAPPVTTALLAVALAAMGLETDIRKLRAKGLRPLTLGCLASLFIAGFSLISITLIF